MVPRLLKLRVLFILWYTVGLVLMLFYQVPPSLKFSNGLFLVFYAFALLELLFFAAGKQLSLLITVLIVGFVTFFIEVLGVQTGYPFGRYSYTSVLGPLVLGVPLTIAMAWVGVILNSLLISNQISKWKRALEVAYWVVVLDLILDPVALVRQFWIWEETDGFFGVPLINFVSWGVIAAIFSFCFPLINRSGKVHLWAVRVFELMLLMFGLLAWKEGLMSLFGLSLLFILITEGRYQYGTRSKKQMV